MKAESSTIKRDIDISTLEEMGNILTGVYMSTLGKMVGIEPIMFSVLVLIQDMLGSILDGLLIELGRTTDYLLLMDTEFHLMSSDIIIDGHLLFIPTPETIIGALRGEP